MAQPETKQAPETIEEISQSIVEAHKYETRAVGHEDCDACTEADANAVAAILSALLDERLNERERCAKIADKQADTLRRAAHVVQQPTEEALRMAELAIVNAEDIARAIRKGE